MAGGVCGGAAGSAGAQRRGRPASGDERLGDLRRDGARPVVHVGPVVPHRGLTPGDTPVVAPTILGALLVAVAGTPVQLDGRAVLLVEHALPAIAPRRALPDGTRQPVPALDVAYVP